MSVDVAIVGSGPAGLAAAVELRRLGVRDVLLLEREECAGGIPRHAGHLGFGMRDLNRFLTGPQYAARYAALAQRAGVDMHTGASVTGWSGPTTLEVTSARGLGTFQATAVILATGCRERPRTARLVPGTRPLGVFTTGNVQQFVYLHHQKIGERAVVVGAEHVSFSAVHTLAHGGTATVAMVTEHPRHQSYLAVAWAVAKRRRVPILTSSRITGILGHQRVDAVEVSDLRTGTSRRLECDTVVFTGDWIPDYELARRGGLVMDRATNAPRIDFSLRTSARGVFAAGNLLHGAESADIAALSGRHAARAVHTFLRSGQWPDRPPLPITCTPPVHWVSPSAIGALTEPVPHGCFILRVQEFCSDVDLAAMQGSRVLWRKHYRQLVPARPIHAPASWVRDADPTAEPVTFRAEF